MYWDSRRMYLPRVCFSIHPPRDPCGLPTHVCAVVAVCCTDVKEVVAAVVVVVVPAGEGADDGT